MLSRQNAVQAALLRAQRFTTENAAELASTVDLTVARQRLEDVIASFSTHDLDARLVERWRLHAQQPDVLVAALEWHPTDAAESFRLDLPKYFAAVFREPTE